MNSVYQVPASLEKFIEVYGNKQRRLHYLAIRFKRAIIIYKPNTLDTVAIEPPNNSIIFIRGKCPPFNVKQQSFLLFTDDLHLQGIPASNSSTDTLLRALFPRDRIRYSFFKSEVLYLIASENPFARFTKKIRRDQGFKALTFFAEARFKKNPLTFSEVAQLRFFKRNNEELNLFNKWASFAFDLSSEPCHRTTYSHPSQHLGKEVFSVLKRSELPPGPLPPSEFYFCEILLSDTEPVGVAFAISQTRDQDLEYVSPLVVSKPRESFRDTSSVMCNSWLPFYRSKEAWRSFGLGQYLLGLYFKKVLLRRVVTWLQVQTSEKYKLIYQDLMQVSKVLFGDESKSFL